jgi:hypothetical protein
LVGKQSARGDDVEMIARKILREKSAQVLLALLAIVHSKTCLRATLQLRLW